MKRESGILYPISSLPSRFGIGAFSKEAYEFVDFLKEAGQSYWQVLPLCQTGFGDSPYQSVSSFAGNPYFIDLEKLIEEGLLTWDEVNRFDFGSDPEKVDYGAMYNYRYTVLRIAFDRFRTLESSPSHSAYHAEYQEYLEREHYWLFDYALYMALKKKYEGKSWTDWEKGERLRDQKALEAAAQELSDDIDFYRFLQFEFDRQWKKLHAYAKEQGIKIIGDIPFYVAMDSAATWAHSDIFKFDKNLVPTVVAGCPPDAFSPTGQLWGNPVYDWKKMKKGGYNWWIQRFARNFEFYDVVRLDHFNGFAEYYEVPYGDKTAEHGTVVKGPGIDFFRTVKKELGEVAIIAEDLGNITPATEKLLEGTGYPGMKVLQFAFDPSESSYYLSYNHVKNAVVYTGTHDNTTTRAWIEQCSDHDRDFARRFIHSENTDYGAFTWDFIREAFRSVCDLCIIPIQDYLVKGEEARLNTPGTAQGNWQWRVLPDFLSKELAHSIYDLTKTYGRLPKVDKTDKDKKEEKKTQK